MCAKRLFVPWPAVRGMVLEGNFTGFAVAIKCDMASYLIPEKPGMLAIMSMKHVVHCGYN